MSTQIARVDQIKNALLPAQKQITSLLQDKERANKFMAASLVVASDRALMDCQPDSVVQALVGVAMLDLSIDKNVGHCYIISYKDYKTQTTSAQLQVGYKGWMQLLFRAGWMVKAFPVFECDVFEFDNNGWDNKVVFKQNIDDRDEGDRDWCYQNLRGIYVVSRNSETNDEYSIFVNKKVIEKLRKVSPNQKNSTFPTGIWKDWYIEMATAKAVKRLAKLLPIGDSRATLALAADDKAEMGERIDYSKTAEMGMVIDSEAVKPEEKKKSRSVDSLVGGSAETPIEAPTPIPEPVQTPVAQPTVQEPIESDYSDMPTDLPPPIGELAPEPVQSNDASLTPKNIAGEIEKIKSWKTMSELITGMNDMSKGYKEFFKKELEEQQRIIKASESTGSISPEQWRERIVNVTSRDEFTSLEREMPAEIKTDEMMAFMKTHEDFCIQKFPTLW